jgi:hypothetical protein
MTGRARFGTAIPPRGLAVAATLPAVPYPPDLVG